MKRVIFISLMVAWALEAQTPEEAINLGMNAQGVGARSLAMGGAMTASANDYTALYWNPACLTLLKESQIGGGMVHLRFNNQATFGDEILQDKQSVSRLQSAGLAYKFPTHRGSFVLGFGYQGFKDYSDYLSFSGFNARSNGLEFELEDENGNASWYPYDRDVYQTEEITQTGHLGAWSVGFGMALSPRFSLGLTASRLMGKGNYQFAFYQDDLDDVYAQYPANFDAYEYYQTIDSEIQGYSARIGGLMEITPDFRAGFSVTLPTTLRIFETYAADDILFFDDGESSAADLESGEWEYLVKFPARYSGGIALDLSRLLLAASFEYCDWTQVRFAAPDDLTGLADFDPLLAQNRDFRDLFRPVLSYSAGAEFRLPGTGLSLRGGYRYVPAPYPDADKAFDRQYVSGGVGFRVDSGVNLHLTYVRGLFDRFSEDSFTPGGTLEAIETQRLLVGMTISMNE